MSELAPPNPLSRRSAIAVLASGEFGTIEELAEREGALRSRFPRRASDVVGARRRRGDPGRHAGAGGDAGAGAGADDRGMRQAFDRAHPLAGHCSRF